MKYTTQIKAGPAITNLFLFAIAASAQPGKLLDGLNIVQPKVDEPSAIEAKMDEGMPKLAWAELNINGKVSRKSRIRGPSSRKGFPRSAGGSAGRSIAQFHRGPRFTIAPAWRAYRGQAYARKPQRGIIPGPSAAVISLIIMWPGAPQETISSAISSARPRGNGNLAPKGDCG